MNREIPLSGGGHAAVRKRDTSRNVQPGCNGGGLQHGGANGRGADVCGRDAGGRDAGGLQHGGARDRGVVDGRLQQVQGVVRVLPVQDFLVQHGRQIRQVGHDVRVRDLPNHDIGQKGAIVKRHGSNADNVFGNGERADQLHRRERLVPNVRQIAGQKGGRERRV